MESFPVARREMCSGKKKKQCTYILLALGKELKIMDSRAGM
jgi:hypothetical protein